MIQGEKQLDFVISEIAEVKEILKNIPEDRPIDKMNMETRLEKLKSAVVDLYERAIKELETILPIASHKSAINTLSGRWIPIIRLNYEDVQENINKTQTNMEKFIKKW